MAGSTFQPPIHLDPSQDAPQQTAFINQNFQSVASTLETNSFRIVNRGSASITPLATSTTWITIPHNLGFIPVPFVFLPNIFRAIGGVTVVSSGSTILPTWTGTLTLDTADTPPFIKQSCWLDYVADNTNLYVFAFNAGPSIGATDIDYYLVQQPASS